MSKKKKKTKEQKKKAIINRQKYLSVIKKPETAIETRQVEIVKETSKSIQKIEVPKENNENKFVISNIKRSVAYTIVFVLIIFVLYFMESQIHFFSGVFSNLVSALTK